MLEGYELVAPGVHIRPVEGDNQRLIVSLRYSNPTADEVSVCITDILYDPRREPTDANRSTIDLLENAPEELLRELRAGGGFHDTLEKNIIRVTNDPRPQEAQIRLYSVSPEQLASVQSESRTAKEYDSRMSRDDEETRVILGLREWRPVSYEVMQVLLADETRNSASLRVAFAKNFESVRNLVTKFYEDLEDGSLAVEELDDFSPELLDMLMSNVIQSTISEHFRPRIQLVGIPMESQRPRQPSVPGVPGMRWGAPPEGEQ